MEIIKWLNLKQQQRGESWSGEPISRWSVYCHFSLLLCETPGIITYFKYFKKKKFGWLEHGKTKAGCHIWGVWKSQYSWGHREQEFLSWMEKRQLKLMSQTEVIFTYETQENHSKNVPYQFSYQYEPCIAFQSLFLRCLEFVEDFSYSGIYWRPAVIEVKLNLMLIIRDVPIRVFFFLSQCLRRMILKQIQNPDQIFHFIKKIWSGMSLIFYFVCILNIKLLNSTFVFFYLCLPSLYEGKRAHCDSEKLNLIQNDYIRVLIRR